MGWFIELIAAGGPGRYRLRAADREYYRSAVTDFRADRSPLAAVEVHSERLHNGLGTNRLHQMHIDSGGFRCLKIARLTPAGDGDHEDSGTRI